MSAESKLLRMEGFSASRYHIPPPECQLVSVGHTVGHSSSSVLLGHSRGDVTLKYENTVSDSFLTFTASALSMTLKIPNSLL